LKNGADRAFSSRMTLEVLKLSVFFTELNCFSSKEMMSNGRRAKGSDGFSEKGQVQQFLRDQLYYIDIHTIHIVVRGESI